MPLHLEKRNDAIRKELKETDRRKSLNPPENINSKEKHKRPIHVYALSLASQIIRKMPVKRARCHRQVGQDYEELGTIVPAVDWCPPPPRIP